LVWCMRKVHVGQMLKGKLSYQEAPLSQAFESSRSMILSRPGRGVVLAGRLEVEHQPYDSNS
jgi:hypothetical protein